jgi:hypothetical protein
LALSGRIAPLPTALRHVVFAAFTGIPLLIVSYFNAVRPLSSLRDAYVVLMLVTLVNIFVKYIPWFFELR